jgi:glycosidase
VDGWRLDVANEVDHDFWRAFRREVREVNPQAYLVGEIWHRAEQWLQGDQFDAVMHYQFRGAVLDFIAGGSTGGAASTGAIGPEAFDARLAHVRMAYADTVNDAQMTLLGSHDTPRILTLCGGADPRRLDEARRKAALATTLLLTYPGAPLVYYGDEVGMGTRGETEYRSPMVWDESRQDAETLAHHKRLIALRRKQPALRRGGYVTVLADALSGVYAFGRTAPEDEAGAPPVLVAVNNGRVPRKVALPVDGLGLTEGGQLRDALGSGEYAVGSEAVLVELGPWQGIVLVEG